MRADPNRHDYEVLDRYLHAIFQLLEGIAEVEEARLTLGDYLEFHHRQGLPPELESFLIELFFEKCGKEFGGSSHTRS